MKVYVVTLNFIDIWKRRERKNKAESYSDGTKTHRRATNWKGNGREGGFLFVLLFFNASCFALLG
jgi:hypothetical protein